MAGSSIPANEDEVGTQRSRAADEAAASHLKALLEETDVALAECLVLLGRVRISEAPVKVKSELAFLQDTLKAARVDLTAHYARRCERLSSSSDRAAQRADLDNACP